MFKLYKISFVALLSFLALRGSTLEYFDLSEPTEARYTAISADMIGLQDWVIPQFPRGMDHEPYLGKPPLYFWLVAASQYLLGFDEWTARLPSFISLLLILILTYVGGSIISVSTALSSLLILSGTAYIYFFSGSVMVDLTLSAWTTLSLISFLIMISTHHTDKKSAKTSNKILFWIGIALGFLTKGPVAIIFSMLPIFLFAAIRKDRTVLKHIFWLPGIAIFLAIAAPWFILAEIRNPGFMHYFFVHENFLRFFVKDYGDKYGSGHRYPYGSALWMLLVGFLPWSLYFLRLVPNWKFIKREYDRNYVFQYLICWSTSIPMFLCFMKQLHPGYLLPAFPGIALSLAYLRERDHSSVSHTWDILVRKILLFLVYCTIFTVIIYFYIKKIHLTSLALFAFATLFIITITLSKRQKDWKHSSQLDRLSEISIFIFFAFFTLSLIVGRELSEATSPASIYRCIASSAPIYEPIPIHVTFVGNRSYTAHFLSEHWENELSKKLQFNLVNEPVTMNTMLTNHIVVKEKYASSIPKPEYKKIAQVNNFIWYAKSNIAHDLIPNCEFTFFDNSIQ